MLKQQLAHSHVDVVYIDLATAFHKSNHEIIFNKPHVLATTAKLGKYLYGILQNRSQTVVAKAALSLERRRSSVEILTEMFYDIYCLRWFSQTWPLL